MLLVLEGQIKTPLVIPQTTFFVEGCKARIEAPRRRWVNKINAGKPMFPYSFKAYLGKLVLTRRVKNRTAAKRILTDLLEIDAVGKLTNEGMGVIHWLGGELKPGTSDREKVKQKLRIRKGLPPLPLDVLKLVQYGLLHDFYANSHHKSKIYVEPELDNPELIELLRDHHNKDPTSELVQQFKRYDQLAAIITREIRSPKTNRYTWASQGTIDFDQLAVNITEANKQGVWALYKFIYDNKELDQLNESFEFGHSSLKQHLLIIANLIVHDFLKSLKN
ncbi:MAG: hypothetical protein ACXACI_16430 [Candidatus Hodarchaeales archaeon]|jgi:hypothetical protein